MRKSMLGFFVFMTLFMFGRVSYAEVAKEKILVELFLAAEQKKDFPEIQAAFARIGVRRVKAQFYAKGRAPQIIGLGREVPAEVGRLTLHIARQYVGEVRFIIPEFLFPLGYVTVGSSHFAEENHVPIPPEDIEFLLDPKLTTQDFYRHYRSVVSRTERFGRR
jgi:hypothetical protein